MVKKADDVGIVSTVGAATGRFVKGKSNLSTYVIVLVAVIVLGAIFWG